jgi:threonine synthase
MIRFFCHNCGRPYPPNGTPYVCLTCGGFFDFEFDQINEVDTHKILTSQMKQICDIGLSDKTNTFTLGEGKTPLIDAGFGHRKVFLKLEYTNPTGSFKDRGSIVLATFLKSQGVEFAIDDSSGNAGASLAAYAARAGISTRIFVPETASGPKMRQIEAFGADIIRIPGSRSVTTEAVKEEARKGKVYASHAYMPHVLAGYASIAFEIVDELKISPEYIVAPVGQGNLLFAIGKAFQFLKNSGYIEKMPALFGVQAMVCAPLWAVTTYGTAGLNLVSDGDTLAEGVKIKYPVRGDSLIQMVNASGGSFLAVGEDEIRRGRDELSHRGFYVEYTSALIWEALAQIGDNTQGPAVAILTGSGLKVDY